MQKKFVRITLLTVLFLVSCATTQEKPELPPFKVGGLILSKTIQKTETSATAINIANIFTSSDTKAVASVQIEGLTGTHELRWEWYDPKGEHFLSSGNYTIRVSEGKYKRMTTAWHHLPIRGGRAMNLPGTWQVRLFFDGNPVAEKNFTIE